MYWVETWLIHMGLNFWSGSSKYGDLLRGSWNVYIRAPDKRYIYKKDLRQQHRPIADRYVFYGESDLSGPSG